MTFQIARIYLKRNSNTTELPKFTVKSFGGSLEEQLEMFSEKFWRICERKIERCEIGGVR